MSVAIQLEEALARIVQLEEALGVSAGSTSVLSMRLNLPAASGKLLGCLLAVPNVTPDMITRQLSIASDAKVAVHRLREGLKTHFAPDEVVIRSQRGMGYWLSPEHKEKIRLITSGVISSAPALSSLA